MRISVTSLPDVVELAQVSSTISCVYESAGDTTERNAVITEVTVSTTDSGLVLTTDNTIDPPAVRISGRYEQQFAMEIEWNRPQVDIYTAPISMMANNWGDVPEPGSDDIWFLFRYTPPTILNNTATYTITVSWEEVDETIPAAPVVTPMTGTFTSSQSIQYDIVTNTAEFMRYI